MPADRDGERRRAGVVAAPYPYPAAAGEGQMTAFLEVFMSSGVRVRGRPAFVGLILGGSDGSGWPSGRADAAES
jgi:hypothetical protein